MDFGNKEINKLSDKGCLDLSFIRIYPSFKIIDKSIDLGEFSPNYTELVKEFSERGIEIPLPINLLKVRDYYLFTKSLFKDLKVIDYKQKKDGRPDFLINGKDGEFYIEFKSESDSIKVNQLIWNGNNSKKEVWFLILGKSYDSEHEKLKKMFSDF